MQFATPPTLTGNPGQPRDLQFRGPFLEMFFDRDETAFVTEAGEPQEVRGLFHKSPCSVSKMAQHRSLEQTILSTDI